MSERCKSAAKLAAQIIALGVTFYRFESMVQELLADRTSVPQMIPYVPEPAPTAQVTPEQREVVYLPTELVIPRFGMEEAISKAVIDKGSWVVPENGLMVIPESTFGKNSPAIIYGHSRFKGQPRSPMLFADLKLHEQVGIGFTPSGKAVQEQYAVTGFHLIDAGHHPDKLLKEHPNDVFLMTSVKPDIKKGNPLNEWIIPKDKLTDFKVEEGLDPDDPNKYVNLIVVLSKVVNSPIPSEGFLVGFR